MPASACVCSLREAGRARGRSWAGGEAEPPCSSPLGEESTVGRAAGAERRRGGICSGGVFFLPRVRLPWEAQVKGCGRFDQQTAPAPAGEEPGQPGRTLPTPAACAACLGLREGPQLPPSIAEQRPAAARSPPRLRRGTAGQARGGGESTRAQARRAAEGGLPRAPAPATTASNANAFANTSATCSVLGGPLGAGGSVSALPGCCPPSAGRCFGRESPCGWARSPAPECCPSPATAGATGRSRAAGGRRGEPGCCTGQKPPPREIIEWLLLELNPKAGSCVTHVTACDPKA